MTFSKEELERYARHIVLADVGGPGQQKLAASKVLVVGAGGLGAPVLVYLAAAGIGTLGTVDDDVVSLSNLQRQVIHDTDAVGIKKVESAARSIARINPNVAVETHPLRLEDANADDIIGAYDIVVDGTDNFATRYRLADRCEALEKPLVTAAVGTFDGSITTLVPFMDGPDGGKNPRYRDLFPSPPPDGLLPTCAEAGVLGALTGVIGSLQALEVIKLIAGVGEPLIGKLLLFDARSMRFETIGYARAPEKAGASSR
ncbi:molybdopterin-synthase adenylyltransferase MoeB [Rhodobium gokarnense]|uniref:Adenylyltransferase/sulfurtransferase n=1 Tax=Rhodobium gokarnense TaxID=364296 RepID=A0ABT3HEC1_9HYPH|nr:molybdopterin-synthase adenylyltransferase MoeB [Rhodobium gokarnense]MCW2308753.1 adenylyltransferase/sulfurtransferase [Rhodobium gokarnense]